MTAQPLNQRPRRTVLLTDPAVRRAAARAVVAAHKANKTSPDPRVVAVAEGREPATT